MRRSFGALGGVVLAGALMLVLTTSAAAAATSSASATAVQRPTVAIVKRGLTRFWDLDQENSVDKITLAFRSVKLGATRRAIPADFVEGAWVTPVIATFDQRTVRTSEDILNDTTIRSCSVYRISFVGIFWKGDFGWAFKNRNTKTKRLSYEYRC